MVVGSMFGFASKPKGCGYPGIRLAKSLFTTLRTRRGGR